MAPFPLTDRLPFPPSAAAATDAAPLFPERVTPVATARDGGEAAAAAKREEEEEAGRGSSGTEAGRGRGARKALV